MECDIFTTLKIESENLKGQLEHVVSLSNVIFTFLSGRWNNFKKNPYLFRKYRWNVSSKATCHYCGDKVRIKPLSQVRNIKVPNGIMTWIPKCHFTNSR